MNDVYVITERGTEIRYANAVSAMCSVLREHIHSHGDYEEGDHQRFFELYAEAHVREYDEDWPPYHGGAW